MIPYRGLRLAVAVAGNTLNGGLFLKLLHLIARNAEFAEIVEGLESTEFFAQFNDFFGGGLVDRAGGGKLIGGGLVQFDGRGVGGEGGHRAQDGSGKKDRGGEEGRLENLFHDELLTSKVKKSIMYLLENGNREHCFVFYVKSID